jgi:Putative lumazine-binding
MHRIILLALLLLTSCSSKPTTSTADESDVRAFLTRYFQTWSDQDMVGYEGCFHAQARISFVEPSGLVTSMGLTDFIHSQRLAHQQTPARMKEVPLEMRLELHRPITQAAVTWRLTKGSSEQTGTDYFTLAKTPAGWRILSLVFNND